MLLASQWIGALRTAPSLLKISVFHFRRLLALEGAASTGLLPIGRPSARSGRSSPIIAEFEGVQTLASACRATRSSPPRGLAGASNPGSTDNRRRRSIKCSARYWASTHEGVILVRQIAFKPIPRCVY